MGGAKRLGLIIVNINIRSSSVEFPSELFLYMHAHVSFSKSAGLFNRSLYLTNVNTRVLPLIIFLR